MAETTLNCLVDSHAHLDASLFDDDREQVIQRALDAGVGAILNVGTNLATSRAAVALAERYSFIYAAVGVHPHEAKRVTPAALDELRRLARHPRVVAIGEIGLDYYRDRSPRPVQRRACAEQLALAAELGMPVVIHCRDAHDDLIAILQGWRGTGVLHAYSGGPERLESLLGFGFLLGISGVVTFPKARPLREVVALEPLDRLLIETDCPYLTPVPYRGRRNEPAYVRYVAEAMAHTRGLPLEKVAEATTANAERLFHISLV
ncbi:MAG: TatD family hydrolase [Anaerolineae bacterium]|nr:TatD family hydrolase [Anaerolineae bacterium]